MAYADIVGWSEHWCHHYGNQCSTSSKLGIDPPQDLAMPLLDIYQRTLYSARENVLIHVHCCSVHNIQKLETD